MNYQDHIQETYSPEDNSSPIGLDLNIETPENVVLSYQLAGPASRIGAFFFDALIQGVVIFGLSVAVACAGLTPVAGMAEGLFFAAFFLINWFYHIASEVYFDGRTIGKKAMGLRVIMENGYPIDFWASVIRNFLRVIDAPLPFVLKVPFYGIGYIVCTCSPRFQRIGDVFARTIVITERRVVLPREPVIIEKIDPIPRDQMNGFVPSRSTLSVIDQFLGRRNVLSIDRGHEIAYPLAMALARKFQFRGDPQQVRRYPMAFLARVYVTFIRTLENDDKEENYLEDIFDKDDSPHEDYSWSRRNVLIETKRK
ncbi:hypothetical protein MNBD_PLANCTO02-3320 [hydrothermal vent metagenome]|uniref:RDD domain-containing protein n=1 Tax=hydrothermal vent metagenome TaxID=652676 RepID=A0A3B1D7I8_9ZZZZ